MNTNGGLLSEAHVMAWNHQAEIVRSCGASVVSARSRGPRWIQWANVYGDSLIYHR